MALADRAKQGAAPAVAFKKPNVEQFVPPGSMDVFHRVVAAAMKLMYAPEMQQHVQEAIQSQSPVPKNIADNTTGLMLTLDQKSKPDGIPPAVLFPAACELAAECATVLTAAKISVSQEDFNDALLILYAQIGKKLGASDDQLMQHAQQAAGVEPTGDPNADQVAAQEARQQPPGTPPGNVATPPGAPPPGAVPPQPPPGAPQ